MVQFFFAAAPLEMAKWHATWKFHRLSPTEALRNTDPMASHFEKPLCVGILGAGTIFSMPRRANTLRFAAQMACSDGRFRGGVLSKAHWSDWDSSVLGGCIQHMAFCGKIGELNS